MSPDWSLEAWDPADCSRARWDAIHRYRRARRQELDPTDPLTPDATFETMIGKGNPWSLNDRFLVLRGDEVIAMFSVERAKPGASGYESNKHIMAIKGGVLSPHRRAGIGTAALRKARAGMEAHDARTMTMYTAEDDGKAFLRATGAELKIVERVSRLAMDEVDWERMARWQGDLETRAPGAALERYPRRLPDDFLEEYCPARQVMMNLMPFEDLDHGEIEVRPEDWHETYARMDVNGEEHHTVIVRESDGAISAITDCSWSPESPSVVWQWFTGVHPDYRGRGLGKAIKADMALLLQERYDDLAWISTGNAATNASMLAINERMGFREHKRWETYQIGREALAAHLEQVGEQDGQGAGAP